MKNNPNTWYCDGCKDYHSNSESFNQCEEGHSYCSKHDVVTLDDAYYEEYNIDKKDCPACGENDEE